MEGFNPTEEQVEQMKIVLQGYGENFRTLAPEVQAKYAEARAASQGKSFDEDEENQATLQIFDASDANGDGCIDESEFEGFQNQVYQRRDQTYGGHAEPGEAGLAAFKNLIFNVSAPAESFTKDDLNYVALLMVKVRQDQ